MTNKLPLLSASRAYLLQSPTCTRVTLNLVYNIGKSLAPIASWCMLVSWKRKFSQRISDIEICMYFATLLVNSFDIIPYHMITVKYILVDGVRLEASRSMGLKSLRDLLRGTTHPRKTAHSNHTCYF